MQLSAYISALLLLQLRMTRGVLSQNQTFITEIQYLYISTEIELPTTVTKSPYYTETYDGQTLYYTSTIYPTATPTNALTTITDTSNPSITKLQVLLPAEATNTRTISNNETQYAVPITFHPRTSCAKYKHNWTTSTDVHIPLYLTLRADLREQIMQLQPLSVTPSLTSWPKWTVYYTTGTYTSDFITTTATAQVKVLDPTEVPAEVFLKASEIDYPTAMADCYTPTVWCSTTDTPFTTLTTRSTTLTIHREITLTNECVPTWGQDPAWLADQPKPYIEDVWTLWYWLILTLTIPSFCIVALFGAGAIEARYQLGKLFRGQAARGGTPPIWGLSLCCFYFCFRTGPHWKARSVEEQAILRARWEALSGGEKYRVWRRWGYTRKYPVEELGPEPERTKRN